MAHAAKGEGNHVTFHSIPRIHDFILFQYIWSSDSQHGGTKYKCSINTNRVLKVRTLTTLTERQSTFPRLEVLVIVSQIGNDN